MKKTILAALMVFIALALTGCGDGGSSSPIFVTQILSDPALDGDIFKDTLTPPAFTITQGMRLSPPPPVQSVFAGIDATPVTGGEFRAFLDFHLGGTGGVPLNAFIVSAFLDLFITSNISGSIPVSIDLVSLQLPTSQLTPGDFNSAFLSTTTTTLFIRQANIRQQVSIDVTPLMAEAQRLGLPGLQVRILCGAGIIEIDDRTGVDRSSFAPLLQVAYF